MKTRSIIGGVFTILAGLTGPVQAQLPLFARWTSYVGGDYNNDAVYAVATDVATNAYFGGVIGDSGIRNAQNIQVVNLNGSEFGTPAAYVAQTDADGSMKWAVSLEGQPPSVTHGIAVRSNTVYAVGAITKTTFDGENNLSYLDAFLLRLHAETGGYQSFHPLWNGDFPNGARSEFMAVALDASGNVYAVGYTTLTNLAGVLAGSVHQGAEEAVIAKYSSVGTLQWLRYYGSATNDRANTVVAGTNGVIYVGGQRSADGFLLKLNSSSGAILRESVLGGSGTDSVHALLKDASSGVLFLGGTTTSTNFTGLVATNLPAIGSNGFVMKLTDNGAFQTNWLRFVGGGGEDAVNALAFMSQGRLVVGGATTAGGWLDATNAFHGVQDGFMLQLGVTNAAPIVSGYVGGSRQDQLTALAVCNDVVLTGGVTRSPDNTTDWVEGGFLDFWMKESFDEGPPNYDADLSYGLLAKWTQDSGISPVITLQPTNAVVYEGSAATFSVVAEGSPTLAYYWSRNGLHVGANTNLYQVSVATPGDNGAVYTCLVSNRFGTVTSSNALLTVIANGGLSVAIEPQAARNAGAQWRISGDATWNVSGIVLSKRAGGYPVEFQTLAGWTAPTSRTVQVNSGVTTTVQVAYLPILATAARVINNYTNVMLTVQSPGTGVTNWTLVESLPTGLVPVGYAGGSWSSVNGTLTFSGTTNVTLSYAISATNLGVYTLSGMITSQPSGIAIAVTGDTQIIRAHLIRRIIGTNVTIIATQAATFRSWTIYDEIPTDLVVNETTLTGPGVGWDSDARQVYWGGGKTTPITGLSYQVSGAPGSYTLTGQENILGNLENIFGDSVVVIPDPTPPVIVPNPDILGFSINGAEGALTFTSVVSQAYMVLTNAVLAVTNGWRDCLSAQGQGATTTVTVPVTGPRLFYRVETR